jgi:hypothetical protein
MTRLIRGLMAIGIMASVFTAAPAQGAQQGTECNATAILTFTPGLSETPTSGTHTGRDGTEECNGPIQGEQPTGPVTVDFDGRYGTRDPDTCSGGGEGWGVANHYVPTKDGTKTFRVIFTVKFGGIAGSLVSGTFDGDYYSGSFTFRPLQGDCINSPVTKAELKFKGTWHEYRSNP